MRRTTCLACLLFLVGGCEHGGAPPARTPSPAPAPVSAPPTPAAAVKPSVREQMWAHFEAARELQRAVAQGRLHDAQGLASWLATKAEPHTSDLIASARRIERAPDLQTAGALTGTLANACSGCHETNHAAPVFAIPGEPPNLPSIEAQMQRHQWAAARLWEGLIGPNDDAWYSGVRVMQDAKIDLRWTTNATPNPDAAAYARTLRALTEQAMNVEGRTARAGLFGAMLYTCASCHAIVRPDPAQP